MNFSTAENYVCHSSPGMSRRSGEAKLPKNMVSKVKSGQRACGAVAHSVVDLCSKQSQISDASGVRSQLTPQKNWKAQRGNSLRGNVEHQYETSRDQDQLTSSQCVQRASCAVAHVGDLQNQESLMSDVSGDTTNEVVKSRCQQSPRPGQ